jgi:manganese/zinc/iron transport system substrate-binding protein
MKLLIITFFLVLTLSGCNEKDSYKNNRILAVSTITIINDMVKNIAGDKVEAVSICGIGYDPHTYKSVPEDSRTIARADIVFVNGFGLEGWIDKLIEAAGGDKEVITVTNGIQPIRDSKGHGDPDPHCWFDPKYAKIYIENITRGLMSIDSVNADFYRNNAENYKLKLDSLNTWTIEQINKIPEGKRILVTSHDAFRYFGEAYGIQVEALQGISTEARAQTADVARLVNLIQRSGLKAVFIETSVNPKLIEQISLETNARIGGTLFSDSVGDENTQEGTYIGAFKHNVNTIVNALME